MLFCVMLDNFIKLKFLFPWTFTMRMQTGEERENNEINLKHKKLLYIVCIWTASLNWLNGLLENNPLMYG